MEYQKIQEFKELIIDSLPPGFKKHINDPLVYYYLESMASIGTMDLGNLLLAVLESRAEIIERFKSYISHGMPQYFVGTQEQIDRLKEQHETKKNEKA